MSIFRGSCCVWYGQLGKQSRICRSNVSWSLRGGWVSDGKLDPRYYSAYPYCGLRCTEVGQNRRYGLQVEAAGSAGESNLGWYRERVRVARRRYL